MTVNFSRRGVLGAIICALAIVRASSLMPVKVWAEEPISFATYSGYETLPCGDLISITLRQQCVQLAACVTANNAMLRNLNERGRLLFRNEWSGYEERHDA